MGFDLHSGLLRSKWRWPARGSGGVAPKRPARRWIEAARGRRAKCWYWPSPSARGMRQDTAMGCQGTEATRHCRDAASRRRCKRKRRRPTLGSGAWHESTKAAGRCSMRVGCSDWMVADGAQLLMHARHNDLTCGAAAFDASTCTRKKSRREDNAGEWSRPAARCCRLVQGSRHATVVIRNTREQLAGGEMKGIDWGK